MRNPDALVTLTKIIAPHIQKVLKMKPAIDPLLERLFPGSARSYQEHQRDELAQSGILEAFTGPVKRVFVKAALQTPDFPPLELLEIEYTLRVRRTRRRTSRPENTTVGPRYVEQPGDHGIFCRIALPRPGQKVIVRPENMTTLADTTSGSPSTKITLWVTAAFAILMGVGATTIAVLLEGALAGLGVVVLWIAIFAYARKVAREAEAPYIEKRQQLATYGFPKALLEHVLVDSEASLAEEAVVVKLFLELQRMAPDVQFSISRTGTALNLYFPRRSFAKRGLFSSDESYVENTRDQLAVISPLIRHARAWSGAGQ